MVRAKLIWAGPAATVLALGAVTMARLVPSPATSGSAANRARHIRTASTQLPLAFEENQGQTDAVVRFVARGHGYTVMRSS